MSNERELLPLARTDALVIKEIQDEVLVYDLERHKAHCLNQASAIVWKHCDGRTTVAEMTQLLETELGATVDADVVWLALTQLRRFHLLAEASKKTGIMKVTRRDLVRKYLPAALTLPLILSVPAPTAAQAASRCADVGQPCNPPTLPCCPPLFCAGFPLMCQVGAP
jgi:hypothetical protein